MVNKNEETNKKGMERDKFLTVLKECREEKEILKGYENYWVKYEVRKEAREDIED